MKLWIVTEGCYSDYHIVAIFETEEEAKTFTNGAEAENLSDVSIESWTTGKPEGDSFQRVYRVEINYKTGEFDRDWSTPRWEQKPRDYSEFYCYGDSKYRGPHGYAMSVISQEHANKLAVEGRQAWLAERAEGLV